MHIFTELSKRPNTFSELCMLLRCYLIYFSRQQVTGPLTWCKRMFLYFASDPTGQLCLHSPRTKRQQPLRLLLQGSSTRFIPGSGYGGHCQGDGLELCVDTRFWRKLWRKWSRCLHPNLPGDRYCQQTAAMQNITWPSMNPSVRQFTLDLLSRLSWCIKECYWNVRLRNSVEF